MYIDSLVKFINNGNKFNSEFFIYNNVSPPVLKRLMSLLDEETLLKALNF